MEPSVEGERRGGDLFWLQAFNVIAANFVLTELLLESNSSSSSDSRQRRVRRALVGGAVLILVNAGASITPRILEVHATIGGQWIPVAAVALPLAGGVCLAHVRPTLAPALRIAFLAVVPTLEATQGQLDGLFSQFPYTCHQNRVASVGD